MFSLDGRGDGGFGPAPVPSDQVRKDRKRARKEGEELGTKFWRHHEPLFSPEVKALRAKR